VLVPYSRLIYVESLPSLILVPETSFKYSSRYQTVRFAYVTSSRVEGKQTHIYVCKPKTLLIYELRQRATKYCRREMILKVWTLYASLSATPPNPSDPIAFYF
jgi:hypothetical protein